MLEDKRVFEFKNNWKVKKGFGEFLKLPFKKTLKQALIENGLKFTNEIYEIMVSESLDVEKNNQKWDLIIRNQKNLKCK